ncbi:Alpha/beta hydrolase fold-1 [Triangularia verruculosa]|uniref:Alpha/beta hydrolase fold-1 n=1 Tax=Triangularia verruculosa TaxID=2587418 RepID=A0AAN7AWS1_9PEZI|nr:Alpha/beta hydrolase fold-1 [Triangularia verruculosa]
MRFSQLKTKTIQYKTPVVFVHGDHQTGNVWLHKADGTPGWAPRFAEAGFTTFIVHRPYHTPGSNEQPPGCEQYGVVTKDIPKAAWQKYHTAPRTKLDKVHWPAVETHCMWEGTGKAGDPKFEKFYAGTVPEYLDPQEQQYIGMANLAGFLKRLPHPAILIGHGSGATISWLAADSAPDCVAAIIAIEPTGPPFTNGWVKQDGKQIFVPDFPDPTTLPLPSIRPYGLSDIPMGFVPPPVAPKDFTRELLQDSGYVDGVGGEERFQPIPFIQSIDPATKAPCYLQDDRYDPVRKLPNLQQIPQCVVTAGASHHGGYDYATVAFLRQAGVSVTHLNLGKDFGIGGNGHMLMLEQNSIEIADQMIRLAVRAADGSRDRPRHRYLAPVAVMSEKKEGKMPEIGRPFELPEDVPPGRRFSRGFRSLNTANKA